MTKNEELIDKLERLDLTNVRLAEFAGVAPSSVQRWTKGTIDPPVMLMRLLDCMLLLQEQDEARADMRQRWEAADETLSRE